MGTCKYTNHRKAKPLKTSKGEYLRALDHKIMELEKIIEDIRREKENYVKMARQSFRGPSGVKGICYSNDRAQGGGINLSFADVVQRLDAIQINLTKYEKEKNDLLTRRKRLVELYKNDESGSEAVVFYYREVMKYTQQMTAEIMGYSVRQVRRIEGKLKVL